MKLRQTSSLGVRHTVRMLPRIRLAALMAVPESAFHSMVQRVEQDDLFRRLVSLPGTSRCIISFTRFPDGGFSTRFFEFKDEINGDGGGPDIETLCSARQDVLRLIRDIGLAAFEELFLHNDDNLSAAAIGARTGLSPDQVTRVNDLINEVAVHSEFYHPSTLAPEGHLPYYKVAVIEKDETGTLLPRFLSPRFLRGRYVVDREALGRLRQEGFFSREELRSLDALLHDMELINGRRSTLYQVLQGVLARQKAYIASGDPRDLRPYSQRDLARETGIDTSLICRAVRGRSIELPCGREVALKNLFTSRKYVIGHAICEIIAGSDRALTDQRIRERLRERTGFAISRRTVNAYKKIFGI